MIVKLIRGGYIPLFIFSENSLNQGGLFGEARGSPKGTRVRRSRFETPPMGKSVFDMRTTTIRHPPSNFLSSCRMNFLLGLLQSLFKKPSNMVLKYCCQPLQPSNLYSMTRGKKRGKKLKVSVQNLLHNFKSKLKLL